MQNPVIHLLIVCGRIMADIDQRYNDALQKADQSVVALYALKEGVTPERSK